MSHISYVGVSGMLCKRPIYLQSQSFWPTQRRPMSECKRLWVSGVGKLLTWKFPSPQLTPHELYVCAEHTTQEQFQGKHTLGVRIVQDMMTAYLINLKVRISQPFSPRQCLETTQRFGRLNTRPVIIKSRKSLLTLLLKLTILFVTNVRYELVQVSCPWPTRVPTPTEASSS